MNDLHQRLSDHLHDQAVALPNPSRRIEEIMYRGSQLRRRRRVVIGVAAMVAIGAAALCAVTVFGDRSPTRELTSALRPVSAISEVPAAQLAERSAYVWDGVEAESWAQPGWGQVVSQPHVYGLATDTAPAAGGNPGQQRQVLMRTGDGVAFSRVGDPLQDLRLMAIADDGDQRIYGLGTSPGSNGGAPELVAVTSQDGGATLQQHPFPIDLAAMRDAGGGFVSVTAPAIAFGRGVVVAAISPSLGVDPSSIANLLPEGTEAPWGTNVGQTGIELYGPPDDMEALAQQLCADGWTLQQGSMDSPGSIPPGALVATTVTAPPLTIAADDGGPDPWFCQSPSGAQQAVDATQVHGPVAEIVPFDEVRGGRDVALALRTAPRLFHSADGIDWIEAQLPTSPFDGWSSGNNQVFFDGRRFVAVFPVGGGTSMYVSTDGVDWQHWSPPPGVVVRGAASTPDGSVLAVVDTGTELATVTSVDGVTWTMASLDKLAGLHAGWSPQGVLIGADDHGVAVLVRYYRDPIASAGGVQLDHERFTLRLENEQRAFTLYDADGNQVDRCLCESGAASASGWLQRSSSSWSIDVVDPATGERYDTFDLGQFDQLTSEIYSDPAIISAPQQRTTFVYDTGDGSAWSVTGLDGLLSNANSFPTGSFVSAAGISFHYFMQDSSSGEVLRAIITGRPGG
jgi:hypothetical protein